MKYLRSLNYFSNRFILRKQFLVAKAPRYGLRFRFKTEDCIGRSIYKTGTYEPEITSYFLGNLLLHKGDIIFDIGANIGWYSLLLPKYFDVTVYAFEPDKLNFSLLEANIQLNRASNVISINRAVSNSSNNKYLYRYKNSNLGRHSLLRMDSNCSKEEVKCVTLDKFVEEENIDIHKIKLIKMDIEGYEYQAFCGALKLLGNVPLILTEFSPALMSKNNVCIEDYLKLFQDAGYHPYQIPQQGPVKQVSYEKLINLGNSIINVIWQLGSARIN